jgi:hypothetical protein
VEKGYECGLTVERLQRLPEKDIVEAFEIEQIAATLEPALAAGSRAGRGGSTMTVGIARLTLFIPDSQSLKEKTDGGCGG